MAISTNQFKNGNHIEVDGTVYKIVEFQHVKPGKGGAFVRTKLRRVADGNVIDRTFRAGEKFRPVRTESKRMQFLYADGSDAHFMDTESYDQIAISESSIADELRWMPPSSEVDMLVVDGEPSDVQLPSAVDLEVTQTDPGVRGDTASGGGTKPATLETGAVIQVPLFVEPGQRIRVDTRSGEYVARGLECAAPSSAGRRSSPSTSTISPAGRCRTRCPPVRTSSCAPWRRPRSSTAGSWTSWIDSHAHGWSVERIQPLERSILRIALVEMLYPQEIPAEAPIPPEGAIEEAIESAKVFCGADAPGFVNGVLAAVLRELRENAHSR